MSQKLALVPAVLLLAACGSSGQSSTTSHAAPAAQGPASVQISGYAFHPAQVTVPPGTRVTFSNHDATSHTATSTGSGFDTGTLKPGQSRTITLSRPGTYTYYCQFHAFMRAAVTVTR